MQGSMASWLSTADEVLRQRRWSAQEIGANRTLVRLAMVLLLFGLFYGAMMGSFRLLAGQSEWLRQIAYSAIKVPLLLGLTFLISLPSFFVLNSLLGLRRDFAVALRSLVAAQAGLAIVLASLAPFTVLWYLSSPDYDQALLFNGLMFAIASVSAQGLVRRYYRPLVQRHPRHGYLLWAWIFVYTLVGIQMAWLLRPFIGSAAMEVEFVRPEAWDNAWLFVLRLVWQTLVDL